jgi:hypothetical protein
MNFTFRRLSMTIIGFMKTDVPSQETTPNGGNFRGKPAECL